MTHYRRSSTDLRDGLAAIAAGVAAGVGVAYLVRLFRQRQPLDGGEGGSRPGEGARLPDGEGPRPGSEADSGS